MRLCEYRGTDKLTNKLVFGNGVIELDDGRVAIITNQPHGLFNVRCVEVFPESVSQFTGLFDVSGWKIFEGDTVKVLPNYGGDTWYESVIARVKYDTDGFILVMLNDENSVPLQNWNWNELTIQWA